MKDMNITPDDPRLTAFALGELEGDEALAIAAVVAADPALMAAVDEVREMVGDLEGALAAEVLPVVEPISSSELKDEVYPFTPKKVLRFPVFWVSGLMAAGFAVLMVVHNRDVSLAPQEEVIRYDLDLRPAPTEVATAGENVVSAGEGGAVVLVADVVDVPAEESAEFERDAAEDTPAAVTDALVVDTRDQATVAPAGDSAVVQSSARPVVPEDVVNLPTMLVEISREEAMRTSVDRTMEKMGLEPEAPKGTLVVSSQLSVPMTAAARPYGGELGGQDVTDSLVRTVRSDLTARSTARSFGSTQLVDSAKVMMAPPPAPLPVSREGYAAIAEHGWARPQSQPVSTFAVDVDTASYSNVRRFIMQGLPPPIDTVRIEELVNAFTYAYTPPAASDGAPVAAHLEVAAAPWAPNHKLVRIGLKAREVANATRAPANLVFLLDVSGSMGAANKLPLAVQSMRLLLGQLRPDDRVAVVTYAGMSGLALPSTPVANRTAIETALNGLRSGGSTNGSNGIELAYDVARAHFVEGGINRVILCTDGDFNVGITGNGELERLIAAKAQTGVFLTALGFGMGNLQDHTLETLADRGNGHYGYIDTAAEARRLFVEQVEGTLATVAKDVKVQVEFNPRRVAMYRLIGYENRALGASDFADDAKDGGEMGAGHTVTALYEVVPTSASAVVATDDAELRYQTRVPVTGAAVDQELLVVHVRAKRPEGSVSEAWSFPLEDRETAFAAASEDFRFASAVAGFGLVLRDSPYRGLLSLADVRRWAEQALSFDPAGRRQEFLGLVERAQTLLGR